MIRFPKAHRMWNHVLCHRPQRLRCNNNNNNTAFILRHISGNCGHSEAHYKHLHIINNIMIKMHTVNNYLTFLWVACAAAIFQVLAQGSFGSLLSDSTSGTSRTARHRIL